MKKIKLQQRRRTMKLRKRSLIIGGIALLAAGVLFIGLLTGCRPFPGYGPHRFCKKDFSEHVLKRMDKQVAKLDLSEDQHEKYIEIRQRVAADLTEGMQERRQVFADIRREMNKGYPDMDAVIGLVRAQLKDIPDVMEKHLDYFVEFYNILDEDQKAEVIQKLQKKMKRCGV
jgi:Spy/CpxP family protein refolding chaperone